MPPIDSSNCCRGPRPELASAALNLLLKKFQRARQCGEEAHFPLFSSPRGKEALIVLLREPPKSRGLCSISQPQTKVWNLFALLLLAALAVWRYQPHVFVRKSKPRFGRLGDFCYSGLLSSQRFSSLWRCKFLD